MKFLVVGLGSMGKRRVRCLQALGYKEIYGFDLREDRRNEATEKYGIQTFADFSNAIATVSPNALIISVPPHIHHIYMKEAVRLKIHFFVEASVVDTDMDFIKTEAAGLSIVAAPSLTLLFHPAIKKIIEIVKSGELGKISNVVVHAGQWLPDWHTYEGVEDYYVSNPATGGAREIVPFQLGWLTHTFGYPEKVCGNVCKTVTIKGAEMIDDTYNCLLSYKDFLVNLTVDVVSRYATTRILINGDKKQLVWEWDKNNVSVYDPIQKEWARLPYEIKSTVAGYNQNIAENMYIEELQTFITAIHEKKSFVSTLEEDHKVLKLLYAIETADKTEQYVRFEK